MGWPDEEDVIDQLPQPLLMSLAGNGMHAPTIGSMLICIFLGIALSPAESPVAE